MDYFVFFLFLVEQQSNLYFMRVNIHCIYKVSKSKVGDPSWGGPENSLFNSYNTEV